MSQPFVDTYFENASPLRYEWQADQSLRVEPLHDHERFTGNRQSTHWNFKIHVPPDWLGRRLKIVLPGTDNIWNGNRIQAMESGRLNMAVSYNGVAWQTVAGVSLDAKAYGFTCELELQSACVQVARNVPYTLTDLDRRLKQIAAHPAVRISHIGATVEGRALEMVELGDANSTRQVLFRAAAHPWESGGTWFVDGLMDFLTGTDPLAKRVLASTCFCVMPMANKDGVWRGNSRFNVRGMDLNRGWFKDRPIDPELAPEGACLQNWLAQRARENRLPKLVVDLHNDGFGQLHIGPHPTDPDCYAERMDRLAGLMRELTWFREGSKPENFRGAFPGGVMETHGVDAVVYELHSEWAEGLGRAPLHTDWQQLGASFVRVLERYL